MIENLKSGVLKQYLNSILVIIKLKQLIPTLSMYADKKSMRKHMCQKIILAVAFFAIIGLELLYKNPLTELTYRVIPGQQADRRFMMLDAF